jgi:hypothetical protein
LAEFFVSTNLGVKTHRTWVIAPDAETLERRWDILRSENNPQRKEQLFHPDGDRYLEKVVKVDLGAHHVRPVTVAQDKGPVFPPIRYAYRSFDHQYIVPDHRLLSRARSELWNDYSTQQVYLTCLEAHSPEIGPPITFTSLLPDNDHYKGSFGGRVLPLWQNSNATAPNIKASLLAHLANVYARPVKAEDMMAYLAAVMAHPGFTARFKADLVRPGLHVPLTADATLFAEAVTLGSEVIWLHCYGERFVDSAAGRLKQAPRLSKEIAPTIPAEGAIPGAPEPLPDTMDYDPAARRLKIGKGYVENVSSEMWAYEVSGMNVLRQWFSYRRKDRTKPIIGDKSPPSPLDKIQPDHWLPEYTSDLLDLLNVLGRLIALEPKQADLLERICAGPLRHEDELRDAGALTHDEAKPIKQKGKSKSKA